MSTESPLPTLRQLDSAPERAVLCVLATCAHSAERMLLHEHPDLSDDDLHRPEPPPTPPATQVAANLLLGDIARLKHSLALYEASVTAALVADRYQDPLF